MPPSVQILTHMSPPMVLMPSFALREIGSSIMPWPRTATRQRGATRTPSMIDRPGSDKQAGFKRPVLKLVATKKTTSPAAIPERAEHEPEPRVQRRERSRHKVVRRHRARLSSPKQNRNQHALLNHTLAD